MGREEAIGKISARNRWSTFYRSSLDGLLAFFDRWFGEAEKGWRNPRALQLCYLLAFMYPLLFVFGSWLATGEGRIGSLVVFLPDIEWGERCFGHRPKNWRPL
ncbi:MAG: hypothetical protein BECKG1743D_GA0114223_100611 [Candidatus Kentron sp. G]|nr:MAG: hypothetical protein BECKG1743F_GA0114225_100237 [Candidatus Kentron sp. G]VFM96491.1 MAG: hypothetical protein BECKG1743E_GA0114224_100641 [Candidatus Kentron sp. G]VFM98391.1 MAG: hypothetical protein BECKG1743D_GA0114223_100611 [Candidatus Kentron sp. G]